MIEIYFKSYLVSFFSESKVVFEKSALCNFLQNSELFSTLEKHFFRYIAHIPKLVLLRYNVSPGIIIIYIFNLYFLNRKGIDHFKMKMDRYTFD